MVEGKVRKFTFWLLAIAITSQFYFVQELLAALAFFAIGFAALAFVVVALCLLQKGWELAAARIFDPERDGWRAARGLQFGWAVKTEPSPSGRRS